MAIIGCYVLHLYCDHPKHVRGSNNEPHEYTGQTEGVAKKEARKDGWLFTNDKKVFCETCRKA